MNSYREDPNELAEVQLERLRRVHLVRKTQGLSGIGLLVESFVSRLEEESAALLPPASKPPFPRLIDLDAAPFVPACWKVESHKKGGLFVWDPAKVALHLEPKQKAGKSLKGFNLQKRLEDKPTANANLLDYYLAHTELIPEGWKRNENGNTRAIYFWGTIYHDSDGDLCVRCLYWCGDRWGCSRGWLGAVFGG